MLLKEFLQYTKYEGAMDGKRWGPQDPGNVGYIKEPATLAAMNMIHTVYTCAHAMDGMLME